MSAPDFREQLTGYLHDLHLPAIRRAFEEKARQAQQETLSYERYLFELVELECQERRQHRITRLLQGSKLPLEKTLENFHLQRLPQKVARQIKTLEDGTFLDRKENLLVFGNPGSGKTHLLSALGQELIRAGRRVAFTTCSRLVQDLLVAKKELRLTRAIRKLAWYEALVIDDLGYVQQDREEMEVLFTLLAERYERGSVRSLRTCPSRNGRPSSRTR
jgi:DNA replication protein DnaC